MNNKILIVGASGTVGGALTGLLQEQGHQVLTTTSKAVHSSNQVHVNLASGEGVKAAIEEVDRTFFLSPPGYADQHSLLSPLIKEAKLRGLKKVILMTAMGANASDTSPFRRAELELEKSGLTFNVIRPNWFFQNFHTFWMHGIATQNKILLPAGNAKVSFIDARDIAEVAAKLLTSNEFDNQTFDLTGPDSIDHNQVAAAISKVAGRTITYSEISDADFLSGLLGAGLPKDYAQFLVMIIGFLRQGYSERRTTSVKEITGKAPRDLNNYINDYKLEFNNQ